MYSNSHSNTRTPDCQRNPLQSALSPRIPWRNSVVTWLKAGIVSTVLLSSSLHAFSNSYFVPGSTVNPNTGVVQVQASTTIPATFTTILSIAPCSVTPTKVANAATAPRKWEDASNWTPHGVPTATDIVLIPEGVSITVSPFTTAISANDFWLDGMKIPAVKALCLQGTLLPDTLDSANVLLEDYFNSGLTGWTGKRGGIHNGQTIDDPFERDPYNSNNTVLTFLKVDTNGDIFRKVTTNPSGKYLLSFDYLGLAQQGSKEDNFGARIGYGKTNAQDDIWLASTDAASGVTHLRDIDRWTHVAIPFSAGSDIYLTLEDFSGVTGDVYFDNIKLTDTTISIKGKVYYDKNCNGRLDPTESGIPGVKLAIDSTKSSTHASDAYPDPITDVNGLYNLKGYDALNYYYIFVNQALSEICNPNSSVCKSYEAAKTGSGLSQATKLKTDSLVGDTTLNIGIKPVASECKTSQMVVLPIQTDAGQDSSVEVAFTDTTQGVTEYTLVVEIDGNRMIKTFVPVGAASVQPVVDTTSADTIIPTMGTDGLVHVKIPYTFEKGGNLPIKAQLSSNLNIVGEETTTAVVRSTAISDSCATGVATIASVVSGDYNNPKTWGGKLPTKNDWVLVRNGHSVTFPTVPKAMKNTKIKFKGFCVEKGAKIYTKSYRTLYALPPSLISTKGGSIRWRSCPPKEPYAVAENCTDDSGMPRTLSDPAIWAKMVPDNAEPTSPPNVLISSNCKLEVPLVNDKANALQFGDLCVDRNAQLFTASSTAPDNQYLALDVAGEAQIDGDIIAGNGSGSHGVNISINAGTLSCASGSKIQAGNGSGAAQNGGAVTISSAGDPTLACQIKTGSGGSTFTEGQRGGYPGGLEIISDGKCDFTGGKVDGGAPGMSRHSGEVNSNANIRDNLILSRDELKTAINCAGGNNLSDSQLSNWTDANIWNDPINIVMGTGTKISAVGSSYSVTDKEGSITINGLQAGAVTAKKVVLSTGNLKINSIEDKAFVAEEEVQIFADNITLPPGKTLADFVSAPKFTQGAYKPLYYAQWSTPTKQIVQEPGTVVNIPLKLQNLGPTQDTYTVTVTDTAGWSLCKLPSQVLVNSLRNTELSCQLTLPQTRDVENFLTLKAVSQGDSSVEVTTVIYLKIPSESIYSASGLVLTGSTPVANAAVQVGDTITYTDDKGYWEVSQLSNGEYAAQVVVDGYSVEPVSFTIAGNNQQNIALNLPNPDVDNGVSFQSNMQTVVSTADGIITLPGSTVPNVGDDTVRIALGKSITPDGQSSVLFSTVDQNGNVKFADSTGGVQLSVDPQGNMLGTDSANPQHEVTMTSEGNITARDKDAPGIVVTANTDGSFTGTELPSKVSVSIDKQGQQIVTHPDFPGMQATVNADNTLTVTDSSDPDVANIAAVFNTLTGQYQIINTADGTCYSEDSIKRWGFKAIASFVSKAASFVAEVADKVAPIAKVVGQVAGTISKVATFGVKVTTFLCPTCTPLIAGLSTVAAVSGTIAVVANAVATIAPKVSSVAQKISAWFARWKSGRNLRDGDRGASACETWRPTTEITEDMGTTDNPESGNVGNYTTHGTLKDKAGKPLANISVQVGDKTTTTKADGTWEIGGLQEGDYTVKGSLGNFTCLSDVALGNDMFQQEVMCKQISSLKVSVKPIPARAAYQGENLSYLVMATNGSDKTATGVVLNNLNLPTGVKVVSLKALNGGECRVESVSCDLPDLAPGTSAQVELILSDVAAGQYHHTIELMAAEFPLDRMEARKQVKPYLSTTVACTPNPVVMLSELHCAATAELSSFAPEQTATGVLLQFTPPKGTMLQTATTSHGTCENKDGKAICAINDLSIADATQVSKATVEVDLKLVDAGLLVLTSESKLTATGYAEHLAKSRTNIAVPKDFKAQLVLAIDTTYSMNKFINGVIKGLEGFVQNSLKDPATAPLTVVVEFKDDVRLVVPPTRDMEAVLKGLRSLKIEGGGTCPEASVEAFNFAADYLADNGVLSIVTNAPPYPDANVDALKQRVADMTDKGAKVFILYEPECDVQSEANQDSLEDVATPMLTPTP